jgi:tetratricopeptide (TPR) repeat protein
LLPHHSKLKSNQIKSAVKALFLLTLLPLVGLGQTTGELYTNGLAKADAHDFAGAEAAYSKVIALDPAHWNAYGARGWARLAQTNLDGALADFNKVIELHPEAYKAWFNRGSIWADKRPDLALVDFTQTIKLKPDFAAAYCFRATLEIVTTNLVGALADANKAISLDPTNSALAYIVRGRHRAGQDDLDGALADFDRAVELTPDCAVAYYWRGRLKQQQKNWTALADYAKAIDLEPNYQVAYEARAVMRQAKGDTAGAAADEKKAAQLANHPK